MYEIHWLGDRSSQEAGVVGGKAAGLSRYFDEHRVPHGFIVPALRAEGDAFPDQLTRAIADAYQTLAERCGGPEPRVAVRSSALDEDGAEASFAGQHATFLNVRSATAVIDAVAHCVRSAASAEALAYRRLRGLSLDDVRIAVLVQQLVPADVAAVAFSVNPVTGDRNEIMINANWGLGESIVGGTATPDTFVVRKQGVEIVERLVVRKTCMTVMDGTGTTDAEMPPRLQSVPSLTDAQIAQVARLAIALEQSAGGPVDVECAIASNELYLLQCRPITTL